MAAVLGGHKNSLQSGKWSWSRSWSSKMALFDTSCWRSVCIYTVFQKNVPPLVVCYNFDTRERILIYCGRNITDEVSNQSKDALLCHVCFCTIWQNGEKENRIFTEQCVARIQQVSPWFLHSFWLATHTHAAVWLPKSCNQCVQLWAGRHGSGERKSTARHSSWTVLHRCTHNACAPKRYLPERKNIIRYVFHSVYHLLR